MGVQLKVSIGVIAGEVQRVENGRAEAPAPQKSAARGSFAVALRRRNSADKINFFLDIRFSGAEEDVVEPNFGLTIGIGIFP